MPHSSQAASGPVCAVFQKDTCDGCPFHLQLASLGETVNAQVPAEVRSYRSERGLAGGPAGGPASACAEPAPARPATSASRAVCTRVGAREHGRNTRMLVLMVILSPLRIPTFCFMACMVV